MTRTVVFSDTHLPPVVEPARLRYLARISSWADKIFILGDLWDSSLCIFDQFVNSNWQVLFPIWQDREAEYFFGNHDPEEICDERVNYFSVRQHQSLDTEIEGLKLHFEHGHRIVRTHNPLWVWGPWAVKFRDWGGTQKLEGIARQDPERIFVCGHTHAAVLDLKNRYGNCGFTDFGWGQYLLIEDGKIQLIQERY